ncbi:MAG: cell division protein SepF [Lachnospiraceae bacterium]|jgi:cell division inhibitor SepF|nr:cell division protein SepF [Lachnospiraceae bacterium]
MPKFIDKILDSMKLGDDEYEDEFGYDDEYDEEPVRPARMPKKARAEEFDEEDEPEEERPSSLRSKRQQPNVVSMRQPRSLEVCMIRPKSVEEGREICDTLLSGRAVVINLEGINMDVAQRIIDFTSGACYSMNGNLQKISSYIFIVTPQSVELSGDFQEILGGTLDMSAFNINI